jgi:hypothetical protein
VNGTRRSDENTNEHDTQGGREQRELQRPLGEDAQQLYRTGDQSGGIRQAPMGTEGDECPHAQDRTGRLPTHDHDHDECDYSCSDERFDQLYVVIHNTTGYVNSMRTVGAQAAEAACETVKVADRLKEHGNSINNLLPELQEEVQRPMRGQGTRKGQQSQKG